MRHPPILGATGVDFGFKPAISIALPKKNQSKLIDTDDPCPVISLICNSISASRSKCDPFVDWLTGKSYLTYSGTFEFIRDDLINTRTHDTITFTVTIDPDTCEQTIVCSTVHRTKVFPGGSWNETTSASCDTGIIFEPYENHVLSHTGSINEDAPFGTYIDTEESWSTTLTDEFTTDALIAATRDLLPDYAPCFGCDASSDGCAPLTSGQDCICSAYLDLSDDEFSCTIRRFKYKFTFASRSGYLKIFWTERFTPEGGGSFIDTPMDWTHAAGTTVTESDEFEVLDPDDEGTTTIVNIRWAISPGCEPVVLDEGDDTCDPDTDNCTDHYGNCC